MSKPTVLQALQRPFDWYIYIYLFLHLINQMSSNKKSGRRGSTLRSSGLNGGDSMMSEGTMFGDLFQCRGDYTTGLFYSGRMRYMHGNNIGSNASRAATAPNVVPSALMPPNDFMTIRQRRDFIRLERGGTHSAGFQRLEFKKLLEIEDRPGRGPQGKGVVQNQLKTVTIQKYPSIDPKDWREEHQAGCKFYVHKTTGEACSEKPWEEATSRPIEKIGCCDDGNVDDEYLGTGSLVYNGAELEDFFRQLDEQSIINH